jgi:N-acetylglutamate synthase-like GNAT family acetyltransferase
LPRTAVFVRDATIQDVPALTSASEYIREHNIRHGTFVPPPAGTRLVEMLGSVEDDPTTRIKVAEVDGEIAGMVVLHRAVMAPLLGHDCLEMSYLLVLPGFERRGVGKALVCAATTMAEDLGLDHVTASVFPQVRNAHRFFARLGFSPLVVRRVAPTAMLRRRLMVNDHVPRVRSALVRRRTVRSREQRPVAGT